MERYEDIYSLSDREITREIGEKIRKIRLDDNITREELQRITGIHSKTIGDAENGKNVTLITLIGILRGLNALDLLDPLVKDEEVSPVAMAMNRGKVRERARGGGR
ncbi:MAG: helix-turn-helix domain-containing protein [Candidatus Methanoplasma sp.]|jgi:transcriptional regulator with XRE-family HTH domain|nr:helix-turn-helix domain-containing protein [Candidatus Methanoplasma sp.]